MKKPYEIIIKANKSIRFLRYMVRVEIVLLYLVCAIRLIANVFVQFGLLTGMIAGCLMMYLLLGLIYVLIGSLL